MGRDQVRAYRHEQGVLLRQASRAIVGLAMALIAGLADAQETDCDQQRRDRDEARSALEFKRARAANDSYLTCLRRQEVEKLVRVAQQDASSLAALEEQRATIAAAETAGKQIAAQQKFQGINWGIGFGYSFGLGAERVEEAEVVNGVVRVTSDVTDQPRLVLELHTYLWNRQRENGALWGVGPYASIQTAKGESGGDTLSSFGLGILFGIQDRPEAATGWNLGIGYVYDSNVQVLGDGIENGKPLPAGETEVRFKRESAGAVMVMFSRQFLTLSASD